MADERLQKILAASGVASRRASEGLIAAGRVTVDGRRANLGDRVDPATARIEVDGIPVGVGTTKTHLALHKPGGVTSTTQDRHAAMTVLDLIPTALVPDGTRLYPVGRLDQDSEGLLFLTNDGEWAELVLHPRYGVEREYAVGLASPLDPEQLRALAAGIQLDEGSARLTAPLRLATAVETRRLVGLLDPELDPRMTWYRATLAQGWKRQLRRMFAAVGAPVQRLVRVRIGSVRIDGLACGGVRRLKAPEIRSLGAGRTLAAPTAAPRRTRSRPPARDRAADSRSSTPRPEGGTPGAGGKHSRPRDAGGAARDAAAGPRDRAAGPHDAPAGRSGRTRRSPGSPGPASGPRDATSPRYPRPDGPTRGTRRRPER